MKKYRTIYDSVYNFDKKKFIIKVGITFIRVISLKKMKNR